MGPPCGSLGIIWVSVRWYVHNSGPTHRTETVNYAQQHKPRWGPADPGGGCPREGKIGKFEEMRNQVVKEDRFGGGLPRGVAGGFRHRPAAALGDFR